jgi:DNA modification methylase
MGLGSSGIPDEADEVPAIDASKLPVTYPGDLWELGRHRLLCADASKPESFARLLGRKTAQMVFIDPPYNVPINGHVCGMGRVKHREFAMASGEMTAQEYAAFLGTIFRHLVAHTTDGSLHYICIDWRHVADLVVSARGIYSELKNLCVWVKDNGGLGSLYRSQHELLCVFKNGVAPHVNNVELGRHGRYRTNVWHYSGVNTLREGRMEELAMHPTVKPVALVADAILDATKRGAVVLDCFGGSGTTLIAAEKMSRRGYVIEIDPTYVDGSNAESDREQARDDAAVAEMLGRHPLREAMHRVMVRAGGLLRSASSRRRIRQSTAKGTKNLKTESSKSRQLQV